MNLTERLAREIRRARREAKLSQESLAEKAGIHRTYVSQLERGLKSPTIEVLERVAGALGSTAADILGRAQDAEDEPCG